MNAVVEQKRSTKSTRQHPLQNRYNKAVALAKVKLRKNRNRVERSKYEVELSWLMRDIESYGFAFAPELYVLDKIVQIESIPAQSE